MDSEQQKIEDAELCERFKNGDQSAFAKLYENNYGACMAFLLKDKLTHFDAEDVVQKSFIKAFKKLPELKDNTIFKSWLFQICLNTFRDLYVYKTRRGDNLKMSFINDDYTLADHIDKLMNDNELPSDKIEAKENKKEAKEIVPRILKMLKPCQAQVIKMHYYQGKQYKEISQELKIPIGTVMSRIYYAKQSFIDKYKKLA
jgi:RNA polymerase sigma-70 factor (ECF subfamily)